jgi:hypothetical protein
MPRSAEYMEGIDYEVDPETGCWLWLRYLESNGYGHDGAHGWAHRISWVRANGPIPVGLQLDHGDCPRRCIRPDHLELVTSGENTRRGSLAKLDWPTVRAIRALSEPHTVTAERFGISESVVCRVRGRKAWWPEPEAEAA